MFVVELIVAAAVPFHLKSDLRARPAQLVAPARSRADGASKPLIAVDRTVRLLSLSPPATDRLLSRIADDMSDAVKKVEAFWGVDWSRDISVAAAGSDEQFRVSAGGGSAEQWSDIAAVTVFDRVDFAKRVVIGQRIVFAPGAAHMSEGSLRIVLTHELFHYAARADTALDAPRWLTEGVADYVARPSAAVPAEARAGYVSLPLDIDLDTPGPQRSLAYDRAWWFARFIADTYGAPKLRAYYLAACGVGHVEPLAAARTVLGTEPSALLANWQQWMGR